VVKERIGILVLVVMHDAQGSRELNLTGFEDLSGLRGHGHRY